MSKSLKWILISLGTLVVLLVILSKTGAFGKDEGTRVTAEKVQNRNITEIVNASGKIYPEVEVKVSPDISGEITELMVQEGDTVKKGQVLARIHAAGSLVTLYIIDIRIDTGKHLALFYRVALLDR